MVESSVRRIKAGRPSHSDAPSNVRFSVTVMAVCLHSTVQALLRVRQGVLVRLVQEINQRMLRIEDRCRRAAGWLSWVFLTLGYIDDFRCSVSDYYQMASRAS